MTDENNNAKIVASILGILLVLSGSQFLLRNTGRTLRCSSGWEFQSDGRYKCEISNPPRYSYCSDVRDTQTGKVNYYCDEAIPEKIDDPGATEKGQGTKYICSSVSCNKISE